MDQLSRSSSYEKQDEVQRLRVMIKNLELENQLLRSRSKTSMMNDDNEYSEPRKSDSQPFDENEILKIEFGDLSDEETWLHVSKKNVSQSNAGASSWNLMSWLRNGIDNNDYQFQLTRRMLVNKIDDLEQGSRRNNIDTRTFTRPKKRVTRPGLETMVESPLLRTTRGLPYLSKTLTISEAIDDISMPHNAILFSPCPESSYLNANFQKLEESCSNTNLRVENTRNIMFQKLEDKGLNSPFRKSEDLLMQNDEWPRTKTNFSKILSEPHLNTSTELRLAPPLSIYKGGSIPDALNTTYKKSESPGYRSEVDRNSEQSGHYGLVNTVMRKMAELNETFHVSNNSRSINDIPSVLDGTFSVAENEMDHNPNKRAASCDSLGDDDYSSASDCSFGVVNCPTNDALGDVQNRARLQEESLKLTMSSPRAGHHKIEIPDDLPSPILHHCGDTNHGYQSDHSDHSSMAKSSRSSQRSSPANSPYGSTNMLAPVNGYYVSSKHQLGGSKLLPRSARPSMLGRGPQVPPMEVPDQSEALQGRPPSALRPPVVRSQGSLVSGLPRPSTNIPRPRSRIPAPKVRKPSQLAQPSGTADWMRGCY